MNKSTLMCEVPENNFLPLHSINRSTEFNKLPIPPDVIDINQGACEICISYSHSFVSTKFNSNRIKHNASNYLLHSYIYI